MIREREREREREMEKKKPRKKKKIQAYNRITKNNSIMENLDIWFHK